MKIVKIASIGLAFVSILLITSSMLQGEYSNTVAYDLVYSNDTDAYIFRRSYDLSESRNNLYRYNSLTGELTEDMVFNSTISEYPLQYSYFTSDTPVIRIPDDYTSTKTKFYDMLNQEVIDYGGNLTCDTVKNYKCMPILSDYILEKKLDIKDTIPGVPDYYLENIKIYNFRTNQLLVDYAVNTEYIEGGGYSEDFRQNSETSISIIYQGFEYIDNKHHLLALEYIVDFDTGSVQFLLHQAYDVNYLDNDLYHSISLGYGNETIYRVFDKYEKIIFEEVIENSNVSLNSEYLLGSENDFYKYDVQASELNKIDIPKSSGYTQFSGDYVFYYANLKLPWYKIINKIFDEPVRESYLYSISKGEIIYTFN